jgi:hypothetical protein
VPALGTASTVGSGDNGSKVGFCRGLGLGSNVCVKDGSPVATGVKVGTLTEVGATGSNGNSVGVRAGCSLGDAIGV